MVAYSEHNRDKIRMIGFERIDAFFFNENSSFFYLLGFL